MHWTHNRDPRMALTDKDNYQKLVRYLAKLPAESREFQMSDMTVRDDSPHPFEYCPTGELSKNTHAGQMKLDLADEMGIMLGLLHICAKSGRTLDQLSKKVAVVVAGAAPGHHFADLVHTFSFVDFHLYDPAPRGWCAPLKDRQRSPNVRLYTQFFTVDTAKEWANKKDYKYEHVIFFSDLRTGDGKTLDEIEDNMKAQRQMTIAVDACYSVLKFRPRYYDIDTPADKKTLEYFDGTVYLQGYPPGHSTETRLHVTDVGSVKTYDAQVYQNQLFYHNHVTRNPAKVLFQPGDVSYDNAHARFVKQFLLQYLPSVSERVADSHGPTFGHDRLRAVLVPDRPSIQDLRLEPMHSYRDRSADLMRLLRRLQSANTASGVPSTNLTAPALSVTPYRRPYDTGRLLELVDFDRIERGRKWQALVPAEDARLDRTNRHVGQYKLFLADLLPIALAAREMPDKNKKVVVVVAGASPGQHWVPLIRLLLASNLGDRVFFELYDGADMCPALKQFVASDESRGRVRFKRQLFEADTARRVRARHADAYLVFLSDIRSAIQARDTHDVADETLIQANMRDQMRAVELMRPEYSCLKFHAPHQTAHHPLAYEPFDYLRGRVCLQAFTYKTSAESRLHVTQADIDAPRKAYDPVAIEEKLFYHNTVRRPTTHSDSQHEAAVWQAAVALLGINQGLASAMQKETVSRLRVYTRASHFK